jgi:SAM-dependent methyltransferase
MNQESIDKGIVAAVSKDRSPARRVSDIFWMSIPVEEIVSVLGKVRVLEVGCGKGGYGRFMRDVFQEGFERYTGIDIVKSDEWDSFDKASYSFQVASANDFKDFISDSNLIITQSALEHFPDDDLYFQQIRNFVSASSYPILQIHLVPSSPCLRLYLLHGYRQYTINSISRITKKFSKETYRILYSLGGRNVNSIHYKYWTKRYFSKTNSSIELDKFNTEFVEALNQDLKSKSDFNEASFFCLVLFHNCPDDFIQRFTSVV